MAGWSSATECEGTRDCDPAGSSFSAAGSSGGSSGTGSSQFLPTGGSDAVQVLGSRLALTGADPANVLAWASVLLAAGVTLVATGRRRLLLTRR